MGPYGVFCGWLPKSDSVGYARPGRKTRCQERSKPKLNDLDTFSTHVLNTKTRQGLRGSIYGLRAMFG
jgi:hypothetical protein